MAYGKVEEAFWEDPVIRTGTQPLRDFLLYILTCRHKNRVGCFVLDPGYAASDLRWPVDAVWCAMAEAWLAGRILYDPQHRVIFPRRYLRHNTLANHKVVVGATAQMDGLPDTPLLMDLLDALQKYSRPHYGLLIEKLAGRIAARWPDPNAIDRSHIDGDPDPPWLRPHREAVEELSNRIGYGMVYGMAYGTPINSDTVGGSGNRPSFSSSYSSSCSVTDVTGDEGPVPDQNEATMLSVLGTLRKQGYLGADPIISGEAYDVGRDRDIVRSMVKEGHSLEGIDAAIRGLRLMIETGAIGFVKPAEPFTLRALYHTGHGVRPLFQVAEEVCYKAAKLLGSGKRDKTGLKKLSTLIETTMAELGFDAAMKENVQP